MPVEIRILGPEDAGVLDAVAPEVFDNSIDIRRAREFLDNPRHHLAVAIDEGQVVGFVSAVHYVHPDKREPELWINEVGVAPTHRRRGLAKVMLETVLDRGRQLGCGEAWVLTDRGNPAATNLYASAGADPVPKDCVMFTFRLKD